MEVSKASIELTILFRFFHCMAWSQQLNHILYLLIRFRCLKYWLEGENKGKTEIFVEHLPGGPDNINLAPDGSFWIALLQVISNSLAVQYDKDRHLGK